VGQSRGPSRDYPAAARAPGQAKRNAKRPRERGGEEGWGAYHLDEFVIGMHWRVDVEDGVGRDTPERRLDVLLDLLMIKLPYHEHGPSRGMFGTISSRRRARRISDSTLLSWNATTTTAPVTSASTKRLTAWRRVLIFFLSAMMGP
jgi:hypothetical protein